VYYRLKFHHKNVNLDAVSEFVSSWFTNSNQRHVLIGSKYSNRAVSCTVQIIKGSDSRYSDNRGPTVLI